MQTQERFAQVRAMQKAQAEAYTALCQHLEHAPDAQLLSDYTATLVFGTAADRREDALRLIRGQLYSRNSRDTGRVESWFEDCCARVQADREGFVAKARQEYVRAGLAEEERQQTAAKKAKQRTKLRVRPACDFAPEQAEYLVEPYLPRGMISILGGVSGVGKTSLALDICARLTRGEPSPSGEGGALAPDEGKQRSDSVPRERIQKITTPHQSPAVTASPEGEALCRPCTVIYLTAENDPNKVLRPRAEAMGADLARLYFQDGASYAMGDEELFALCRTLRPDLIVFDPIQSYLGQGVQMNRAEQVRPLLDGLGALAKELNMAVLLISHMSKPGPGVCSALDRLLGSSDFRNAARSILIAGRDPQAPDTRVFAHAKNSLGVPGESQRYHICADGTVAYDGPCELTADAIIQETGAQVRTRPAATLNAAVEALDKQLGFMGWVEVGEAYRLCAQHSFSTRTMRNAKEALGLKNLIIGKIPNHTTYWYRSELDAETVRTDILNQNQQLQLAEPVSSGRKSSAN